MAKLVSFSVLGTIALGIVVACGSSGSSGFEDTDAGASSSSGDPGSSSGNTSSSGSIGSSSGGAGDSGLDKCATETQAGKQAPLDLLVMLDASGSMLDTTGNNGPTKWAAVKTALTGFINDAKSAGIGVGLTIFPVEHAGAPASCTSSADCGPNNLYGKCGNKLCVPVNTNTPVQYACDTSADCPGNTACLPLGLCVAGPITSGNCLVGSGTYGCLIGSCKPVASSTCDGTECFVSDYSAAKVPIGMLPGNAATLSNTINGMPNPSPNSLTPTSKAVEGGLAYAKQYAQANPGHIVAMVLATDGFPTRCAPMDIPGISALASASAAGNPAIKTFVIGVFADAEAAQATTNLNQLATGGGTAPAFIIKTSGNVTADFQAALDKIRGSALPCDYAVPTPEAGTPDFTKVNVQYTSPSGTTVINYKANAGACDPNTGGWYYDVDPSTGGAPTKITLCPKSCDTVKQSSGAAKVEVVLGCKTVVQ